MNITHLHKHLWIDSAALVHRMDERGNSLPLKEYLERAQRYATKHACEVTGNTKKVLQKQGNHALLKLYSETYNNTFGWMGEVLCEYWLRRFGHFYGVKDLMDTSLNQYCRGYDFTADTFEGWMKSQIQVKMRADEEATFTEKSLRTFFSESNKAKLEAQFTILMVPTSTLNHHEILDWHDGYRVVQAGLFRLIGQREMSNRINQLPSPRGFDGQLEFFTGFFEALTQKTECFIPDPNSMIQCLYRNEVQS